MGLLFGFLLLPATAVAKDPVVFTDATGWTQIIEQPPRRIVSLVPSITEILFRIGAGDAVCGVTYHDVYPPEAATKAVVGGFLAPSLERIEALGPDIIFLDDLHDTIAASYADKNYPRLIRLRLSTFDDLYQTIRLLGNLFDRRVPAEHLIGEIQADLSHTMEKIAPIHRNQRKRVIRLMGRDQVMTPGDDSFQNEMIRRAGGIPPTLGKPGSIVPITLEEWQSFNPQLIYGCGGDRKMAMAMLDQPGWREVDAVKNGLIIYFPCDLTCRLSTRSGYFVSCLASRIYTDEFVQQPPVRPDGRIASRSLPLAMLNGVYAQLTNLDSIN